MNNERNMSTSLIKKLLEKSGKDKNVLNNKEVRDELFTFIVAVRLIFVYIYFIAIYIIIFSSEF